MLKVKTMTEWPDGDYSYPLPDVSHISRKKALKLRTKAIQFITFGFRDQIKSDKEFEVGITLAAQWNQQSNIDEEYYEENVMEDVELYRFWWYHGRRLQALRKKRMPPFIKKLVREARYGPLFFGSSLYRLELEKFRCLREYFSYSFVADEDGDFSFKPWMDICIRLLEHIVAEGYDISDEQCLHVNVRNVRDIVNEDVGRYNRAPLPSEAGESGPDKVYYGRKIYVRKAERLYYQIRLNKMRDWWEP